MGTKKRVRGVDPLFAVGGGSAPLHDTVEMRMEGPPRAPCVEDGASADPGAEIFRIGGGFKECFLGGVEQGIVDKPWRRASSWPACGPTSSSSTCTGIWNAWWPSGCAGRRQTHKLHEISRNSVVSQCAQMNHSRRVRQLHARVGRPVIPSAISNLPPRLSVGESFIVKGLLLLLLSLIESDDFFLQVFGIV
jgi:hypothetical protein